MNMNDYKHVTQRMHPSDACKHEILRAAAQNEQPRETRRQIFWKNLPVAAAGMAACLSLIVGGAFIWQNRADFAPRTQSQVPDVSAVTEEVGASLTTTATTLAQVAEVQTETAAQVQTTAEVQAVSQAAETAPAVSAETEIVTTKATTEAPVKAESRGTTAATIMTTAASEIKTTEVKTETNPLLQEVIIEDDTIPHRTLEEIGFIIVNMDCEEYHACEKKLMLDMFGEDGFNDSLENYAADKRMQFWREFAKRYGKNDELTESITIFLQTAFLIQKGDLSPEEGVSLIQNFNEGKTIPEEIIEKMNNNADLRLRRECSEGKDEDSQFTDMWETFTGIEWQMQYLMGEFYGYSDINNPFPGWWIVVYQY